MNGHFRVVVRDGTEVVAQAEGGNVMCTQGYIVLAQALLWSAVVDQNANGGFFTPPVYLFPVYGAIGTGVTVPSSTDTQLSSEAARAVVYAGSVLNTTWTLNFFYGPTGTYTISEAGVFVQATSVANSGQILDHALISPTVTKNVGQTATLSVTFTQS